jgi:hypothetical protein
VQQGEIKMQASAWKKAGLVSVLILFCKTVVAEKVVFVDNNDGTYFTLGGKADLVLSQEGATAIVSSLLGLTHSSPLSADASKQASHILVLFLPLHAFQPLVGTGV